MWYQAVWLEILCQPLCYARPAAPNQDLQLPWEMPDVLLPDITVSSPVVFSPNMSAMPRSLTFMVNSSSSYKIWTLALDYQDELEAPLLHFQGTVHIGTNYMTYTHRSAPIFHRRLYILSAQKISIIHFLPRSSIDAWGCIQINGCIQSKEWFLLYHRIYCWFPNTCIHLHITYF